MQRLQRFKGQIVVTVTVTSEVMGARKAGKCEAPTLRDEHTMQRIGGGQGLRVRGAAHTEHVWPGWERRATRSPKKNNPFLLLRTARPLLTPYTEGDQLRLGAEAHSPCERT